MKTAHNLVVFHIRITKLYLQRQPSPKQDLKLNSADPASHIKTLEIKTQEDKCFFFLFVAEPTNAPAPPRRSKAVVKKQGDLW